MQDTLVWVRRRLEEIVVIRDRCWTYAEHVEYGDLCTAELWLLERDQQQVAS